MIKREISIGKHVYQREETVEVYEESHYIEDGVKEKIANQILDLLNKKFTSNTGNVTLKILDAGIGGGRLILLSLLDAAIQRGISLEIVGIDNSKPMIDDLEKNLKAKYQGSITWKEASETIWLNAQVDKSSITVYNFDLENYRSILNLKTQFDAVISVLTLHHLKNWRSALYSLVRSLKKGGYLILFEWTKGIKLRDGNFVDADGKRDTFEEILPKIIDFWKFFYLERNKYHPWVPEIMASDYSKINGVLKEPFFHFINGETLNYTWNEKKEVTWNTLKRWIEKRAYSNFHRGLSDHEHKKLLRLVNDYLININNPTASTDEKLGCRLRIFKKQSKLDDFEKTIIFDSIFESSIYEKLIYEQRKVNSNQKQLLDLATLLIQHDVITNSTSFFTINLWDILINDWHKGDKPLVFNKGFFNDEDEFHKHVASVLLYYAIIEKFEKDEELISGTTFIFRELLEKPVVTIHKTTKQRISRFFIRNIRTKTIEILLPESLLNKENGYLEGLIKTAKEKVKCLPNGVWKPLKEDIWNLIFDDERVKKLLAELQVSIDKGQLFGLINGEIFAHLLSDLKECFSLDPELIDSSKDKQITNFCRTLAFHLLITNWDSMIYVPSEVLLPGENYPFGFGGLILAEENRDDEVLKYYLSKRAEMLRIAINMKFRAIGAGQWANKMVKDTKEKEQILINTYHDITRHIITPDVKSLQKEEVKYLRRKLEFMRKVATDEEPESGEIKELTILKVIDFVKKRFACEITYEKVYKIARCYSLKSGIETIIENMISNTIRHNEKRELRKAYISVEEEKGAIVITYRDMGEGFEDFVDDNDKNVDIREKFENWRKGLFSETDKRKLRGTGIRGIQLSIDYIGSTWEINWGTKKNNRFWPLYKIILPKPYPKKWEDKIGKRTPIEEELKIGGKKNV